MSRQDRHTDRHSLRIAALALTLAASATGARAADMGPSPVFSAPPKTEMVELGSGWYLRGDASFSNYTKPKVSYANIEYSGEKIESAWGVGGGFGYKFLNWLRADVTLDYRFPATFRGRTDVPGFYSLERARVNSYSALLNGYLDLGTWSGITPYIGAGIGAGGARMESYVGTNYTAAGALVNQVQFYAKERNQLAWALMAGVAVDVGSSFALDLGYRYLNIGDASSIPDVLGNSVRFKDLNLHEFRIGLRYMIDGQ